MPVVYDEPHRLAARYIARERMDHTLQPTAHVHEAYLHLVDQSRVGWQNRAHFFGVASRLMRRILVDRARAHKAAKRGGGEYKLIQRKHPPQGHSDLSHTLLGLGNLMVARGEAAKSEPLLREAVELRRSKLPADNWQMAEAEGALGDCLAALGRFEEAERLMTDSLTVLKKTPGEQNWRTRLSISRLNNLYKSWSRPDKVAQVKKS
ncbi:MAG TPA: ECF-type sigma factor [Blastocatellia bacterium]|nr:ECF-type sigma factor [Blastocatellia bacterium]